MNEPSENIPVIVFGTGGHAKVVIETIQAENRYNIIGLIDSYKRVGDQLFQYQVLGGEADIPVLIDQYGSGNFIIAIGDNYRRAAVCDRIVEQSPNIIFMSTTHPSAIVSDSAKIGAGVVIMPGAVVNAESSIADGCIVNTRASIDHDCMLKPFSSLAPGATLGGNVQLGTRVSVGLGASIKERISIGPDSVIGAGACVVNDIRDSVVAYGVPCKPIKLRKAGDPYLS